MFLTLADEPQDGAEPECGGARRPGCRTWRQTEESVLRRGSRVQRSEVTVVRSCGGPESQRGVKRDSGTEYSGDRFVGKGVAGRRNQEGRKAGIVPEKRGDLGKKGEGIP